jgi:hypothetical protein
VPDYGVIPKYRSFKTAVQEEIRKVAFGKIGGYDRNNVTCKRRARRPFGHYNKRIVIILEPGDVLAMRLEKSRTTYRAELDDVFRQLAHWHALAEVRRKREDRAWRRR